MDLWSAMCVVAVECGFSFRNVVFDDVRGRASLWVFGGGIVGGSGGGAGEVARCGGGKGDGS